MLSDRPYMRDDYPQEKTSVLTWLLCAVVATYILQFVSIRLVGAGDVVEQYFSLSASALKSGWAWTLLTYSFVHSTGNLMHIVANVLGLYFLGRTLLPVLGTKRFLGLYAGAVLLGGVAWMATNWTHGTNLIGASAGVMGLLMVFACFQPNQPMTFLLFFIFPVTIKPKYFVGALALIDFCGFIFYEIMGAASPFGFAHSAHLGGMLAGWLYFRFAHDSNWSLFSRGADIELPRWAQKRPAKVAAVTANFQVNLSSREHLRAEVDRILDKINSQGFGSLTPDEKRLLDEAKDLLSRR